MRLTFLGTGTSQGVPVIGCRCGVCRSSDARDKRLRTSALVQVESSRDEVLKTKNILIDIGPDFRQQMLREGVEHLEGILITHSHRDHVGGLDDIRAFNYIQGKRMEMYMNAGTAAALRRDYGYVFEPHRYPGLPEAELHEVDGFFEVSGVGVMPIEAMHKDLPILGYRMGRMAYITDANFIAEGELEKLRGVDTLVLNALRKERHFSHFCLAEALEVVERVGPRRTYLTHVSHEMGLHGEVEKGLPEGVFMAYDDLTIEI